MAEIHIQFSYHNFETQFEYGDAKSIKPHVYITHDASMEPIRLLQWKVTKTQLPDAIFPQEMSHSIFSLKPIAEQRIHPRVVDGTRYRKKYIFMCGRNLCMCKNWQSNELFYPRMWDSVRVG